MNRRKYEVSTEFRNFRQFICYSDLLQKQTISYLYEEGNTEAERAPEVCQ